MRIPTLMLLCLAVPAAAAALPIGDLHQNFANGTPILLGQTHTASGAYVLRVSPRGGETVTRRASLLR